jgi:glycosyltransferase involved in cell wall biosynthesis
MRVDFLITELRTGGAERCLTEIALGLTARGDWVRVMSLAPLPNGSRDELVRRLFRAGIAVSSVDARGVFDLPRAVSRVQRWLLDDPPDCLQSFLFHANIVGALAMNRAKLPGFVGGVRVAQDNAWRIWLERRAARKMDRVICVSQSVAAFVRRKWPRMPAERILTIPNGIEPTCWDNVQPFPWNSVGLIGESPVDVENASEPERPRQSNPVALFLGRLHHQKGVDLLLTALPRIWEKVPRLRVAIVGEGPLEGEVREFVAGNSARRVQFLPWQSNVGALYRGADLVLLPSRYEGMPNVILEAMAAGCAVAAARVHGVEELLGPLAAAQVYPPESTDALVEHLQYMLLNCDLGQLGRQNRARVANLFNLGVMVDQYRAVYAQVSTGRTGKIGTH